jgi:hypothetical protein
MVAVVVFVVSAVAVTAAGVGSRKPDPVRETDHELVAPPETQFVLRSVAKDIVARDVVAGRRSLPDAAALFDRLNAICPRNATGQQILLAAEWEGLSDGEEVTPNESLGLQVILWALRRVEPGSSARAALVGRLRNEYWTARKEGLLANLTPATEESYRDVLDRAAAEPVSRAAVSSPGGRVRFE